MLKLNGIQLPLYVKITSVLFSILPPTENKLLKIRGRNSMYDLGKDTGIRQISVQYRMKAEAKNGVMSLASEFAEWLNHEEAVSFEIEDLPGRHFMVLLDGDTDVSEITTLGQGELTFLCTDPYAFGEAKSFTYTVIDEEPFNVVVAGTAPTFPVIDLHIKEDVTQIAVVTEDAHILLGEEIDADATPTNTSPIRLKDPMVDPATWTAATSVDGGVIFGSFSSNGYSFQQLDKNYGTGTGWHGAAAIKSLTQVITGDFVIDARIGFRASRGDQIGRVEVYCLDENNQQFGKVALRDFDPSKSTQKFEARAGKLAGGHYFADDWGSYKGVWKNLYEGQLKISRTGNLWMAHIGIYDADRKVWHTRLTKKWTDKAGIAVNPLAKVQIHMATYKAYGAISTMYFSDIAVNERLVIQPNETPILASAGDILTIDNAAAIVYKNGEPFFEAINPSTKFISLKKGPNGITVFPPKADATVSFTERWL